MRKESVGTPEQFDDIVADWMREIEPYNHHRFQVDIDKAALLVVDMQNYFIHSDGYAYLPMADMIIPRINDLVGRFRESGRPVVLTAHAHDPDGSDLGIMGWWWNDHIDDGTWGAEISDSIDVLRSEPDAAVNVQNGGDFPADIVIKKQRYSAFVGTDLEARLNALGVEHVVISGVMTNLCCETTARDAFQREFKVTMLADAMATANEEMHLSTLRNMAYGFAQVITAKDLTGMF